MQFPLTVLFKMCTFYVFEMLSIFNIHFWTTLFESHTTSLPGVTNGKANGADLGGG